MADRGEGSAQSRIGVLALQGGFAAHVAVLRRLGVNAVAVRRSGELERLSGLILPGGESSALLRLMADEPWFHALRQLHARGAALFATCAGCILLARSVASPSQASAGLLDADVVRNAYGRQSDSFEAWLDAPAFGGPLPGVFIRAPRLAALGRSIEVLARHGAEPTLVRQDRLLAATFHPELTADDRVHRFFLRLGSGVSDNGHGGPQP
jgi:pyridoxal 5'-phosphate synthase pdxT subunit